ncbi:MAG: hypothetical protein E7300_09695 [Lachnospiraceae bacterium]|nr:hypothetical protein [Lachnospiraceae bacterium]
MNYLFIVKNADDLLRIEKRIRSLQKCKNKTYICSDELCGSEKDSPVNGLYLLTEEVEQFADDAMVYDIIKGFNDIIKESGVDETWIFEMGFHIEGGIQQRFKDLIAYHRYLLQIVQKYSIEVIYYSRRIRDIEKLAVRCIKKSGLIRSAVADSFCFKSFFSDVISDRWYFLLVRVHSLFIIRIPEYLNLFIRKLKSLKEDCDRVGCAELVFLSDFTNRKHTSWTIRTMQRVQRTIPSAVVTFGENAYKTMYSSAGIEVISAERFFAPSSFFCDWIYWEKRIRKVVRYMLTHKTFSLSESTLHNWLKRVFYLYLCQDVIIHIARKSILERLFVNTSFNTAFIKGDSNFVFPRMVYYTSAKIRGRAITLLKDDTVSNHIYSSSPPPDPYCNIIKGYFIPATLKEFYAQKVKDGFAGQIVLAVSLDMQEKIKLISSSHNPKILWAPSYVLLGDGSRRSFQEMNATVFKIFDSHQYRLYAKFHPGQPLAEVDHFISQYHGGTITFLDKEEAIETALEGVDIVITTPSTVCFDSLIKGKLLIVLIDGFDVKRIIKLASENLIMIYSSQLEEVLHRIIATCQSGDKNGYISEIITKENEFIRVLRGAEKISDYTAFIRDISLGDHVMESDSVG